MYALQDPEEKKERVCQRMLTQNIDSPCKKIWTKRAYLAGHLYFATPKDNIIS